MTRTFVLCTGRCGSTYLVDVLNQNGMEAYHEKEPDLFDQHKREMRGGLAGQEMREIIDLLRKTRASEDAVYVNSRLSAFPGLAAHAFPRARFMHLVRNPEDSVTSVLRARDHDLRETYGGETMFEAACRWWTRLTARIVQFCKGREQRTGEPVSIIRFEDLVRDRFDWLEAELGGSLEPVETAEKNATPERLKDRCPDPGDWSEEQREVFNVVCAPLGAVLYPDRCYM